MLNMRELSTKALDKYNLEKNLCMHESYRSYVDIGGYIVNIALSDWWVLGIDDYKNIVYAQMDHHSYADGIGISAIRSLTEAEYVLLGVCENFVDGLDSTRKIDKKDGIEEVKEYIDDEVVYVLKYVGINMEDVI